MGLKSLSGHLGSERQLGCGNRMQNSTFSCPAELAFRTKMAAGPIVQQFALNLTYYILMTLQHWSDGLGLSACHSLSRPFFFSVIKGGFEAMKQVCHKCLQRCDELNVLTPQFSAGN